MTTAVIDELVLRMARELGVSGVVVTHDMKSAFRVANRIAMLYNGQIRFVGTVQPRPKCWNVVVSPETSASSADSDMRGIPFEQRAGWDE